MFCRTHPDLTEIDLTACGGITDKGLSAVGALAKLEVYAAFVCILFAHTGLPFAPFHRFRVMRYFTSHVYSSIKLSYSIADVVQTD